MRVYPLRILAACVVTAFTVAAQAAVLSTVVLDSTGHPAADMVVVAQPASASTKVPASGAPSPAVMDQLNTQFVPYVLVVRAGTPVVFPNSDAIAHQVYSFSPAKRFSLGLYRGQAHPPVVFDQAGVVVVGCNIHDNMIGYIYVTDAPFFGKTDAHGRWQLDALPAGTYRVRVWSPRLARQEAVLEQNVTVEEGAATPVAFKLTRPLQPAPAPRDSRVRDY